jgi:hypothetical protein
LKNIFGESGSKDHSLRIIERLIKPLHMMHINTTHYTHNINKEDLLLLLEEA